MVLDHSQFLSQYIRKTNQAEFFALKRKVYFTKSCQQVWGLENQPFIFFIHHICGEIVP